MRGATENRVPSSPASGRARSVEAFTTRVAFGALLIVVLGVEVATLDLAQDLAGARQLAPVDEGRWVPERRSHERFRAVGVRGLDVDENAEPRWFALDGGGGEERLIRGQRGAAIDAKRVAHAGQEEQQPDAR